MLEQNELQELQRSRSGEYLTFIERQHIGTVLKGLLAFALNCDPNTIRLRIDSKGDSYTDGKSITVSLMSYFYDRKYGADTWGVIMKMLAFHESQHVNSSKFSAMQEIRKWYGEYLKTNYGIRESIGQGIGGEFLNIVEDGRIELINVKRMPGNLFGFRFLNSVIREYQKITSRAEDETAEFDDFYKNFLSYCKTGLYAPGIKAYHKTRLEKEFLAIKELADKGIEADTADDCVVIVKQILVSLSPYFADLLRASSELMDMLEKMAQAMSNEWSSDSETQTNSNSDSGDGQTITVRVKRKPKPGEKPEKAKKDSKKESASSEKNDEEEDGAGGEDTEKEPDQPDQDGQGGGADSTEDSEDGDGDSVAKASDEDSDTDDGSDREAGDEDSGEDSDNSDSAGDSKSDTGDSDSEDNTDDEPDQNGQNSGDDSTEDSEDGDGDSGAKASDEDSDTDDGSDGEAGGEDSGEDNDNAGSDGSSNSDPSDSDSEGNADNGGNSGGDSGDDSGDEGEDSEQSSDSSSEDQHSNNSDQGTDSFDQPAEEVPGCSDEELDELKRLFQADVDNAIATERREEQNAPGLSKQEKAKIEEAYVGEYVRRFSETFPKYAASALPPELMSEAKALRREFERTLKTKKVQRRGLKKGVLDASGLWKVGVNSPYVFQRKGQPIVADCVVFELIDNSGSMSSVADAGRKVPKYTCARTVAAVIEEAIRGLLPCKISLFDVSDTVNHCTIKDFKDNAKVNRSWSSLRHIGPQGGNKDGYSIRVATAELLKQPQHKRILLLLSDGMPSDYNGGTDAGKRDVKAAVKEARRKGITVIPIMFGDYGFCQRFAKDFEFMYERDIIACSASNIMKEFKRLFSKFIQAS